MAKDMMKVLDPFATALAEALGDNLVALLLYGSAARGAYDSKRSDLNTVVILRDASAAALRPIGQAVKGWVASGQPAPLIFSERGWRAATDVFPIEIEDMRDAHRLLRGTDPFEGLATARDHLRHELEREARAKLLQLRAAYAAAEADGKLLGDLLLDSAPTFFVLMRAVLRVAGRKPPTDQAELVRETAELTGIEADAFSWALARLAGEKRPSLAAYDSVGAQYVDQLGKFVDYVDQL